MLFTVGHLFCGIGGGASGFARATFGWKGVSGRFRTVFGIDSDGPALAAFERLSGGPGHQLDLFSEDDYRAFHGQAPPAGWREIQPADLRRLSPEAPDVLFTSPPCVGLSRLISSQRAATEKYQAINRLTVRGMSLALSAWDRPPRIILLENVPGMAEERGRHLLEQIETALVFRGYSVGYVAHCLGELGGLGARRRRFMLVARHQEFVPPHLFQPEPRGLISIGEALGDLPMPDDPVGGPMHKLGRYKWITWLRLALVPAGRDWRALKELRVVDGVLQDLALVPASTWQGSAHAVADPRIDASGEYGQLGVVPWTEPLGAVTGQAIPGGGRFSIEDPRLGGAWHNSVYRIARWDEASLAITGCVTPASSGGIAVSDPRIGGTRHNNVFRLVRWSENSAAITTGASPSAGGLAVADPRSPWMRKAWAGAYGVVPWSGTASTVTASASPDNTAFAVADPRGIPAESDRGVFLILSEDGTWHRPITRLEAAVLQGFRPEDMGFQVEGGRMVLEGSSTTQWQRWVGNAVPPPAAARVAEVVGRCLLQADTGETFLLSSTATWARPLAAALSVASRSQGAGVVA